MCVCVCVWCGIVYLMHEVGKIMARRVKEGLKQMAARGLPESQSSFRKGCQYVEMDLSN